MSSEARQVHPPELGVLLPDPQMKRRVPKQEEGGWAVMPRNSVCPHPYLGAWAALLTAQEHAHPLTKAKARDSGPVGPDPVTGMAPRLPWLQLSSVKPL